MEDISGLIEFIRKEFNKSLNSFSFPKTPTYLYRPIEYSLKVVTLPLLIILLLSS